MGRGLLVVGGCNDNRAVLVVEFLLRQWQMEVLLRLQLPYMQIRMTYVPVAQLIHAVEPAVAWYLPASQLVRTVDPVVDWYFPDSQLSHAVLTPADALNFPASQLVHTVDQSLSGTFQEDTADRPYLPLRSFHLQMD